MKLRHAKLYCFCPECVRCGCGAWERHHSSIRYITKWWWLRKYGWPK